MSGVILSYQQTDQVKLLCRIDLKQLFPATKKRERGRFEKSGKPFLNLIPVTETYLNAKVTI
jgi:hypothetical protein